MNFVHDAKGFDELVPAVATARGILPALVEKDFCVTHTLWALHQTGLEIGFKGGTALSKGYGIMERFSEDVHLCIKPGTVAGLPAVTSWTSVKNGPIASRVAFYTQLLHVLPIHGARVVIAPGGIDSRGRSAAYFVEYPGRFLGTYRTSSALVGPSKLACTVIRRRFRSTQRQVSAASSPSRIPV